MKDSPVAPSVKGSPAASVVMSSPTVKANIVVAPPIHHMEFGLQTNGHPRLSYGQFSILSRVSAQTSLQRRECQNIDEAMQHRVESETCA